MLNHHYHFGNKAHKCHLPGHNLFPMSMMKEMSQFVPGKHRHTPAHKYYLFIKWAESTANIMIHDPDTV
ncbi:hypothetical protein DERF_001438 [Dermatophagoides farinae]|uniref:Uncharacterized protein n=1 Tax=Dermatophagoides farinae TaxID=6954 RepID=A0A922L9E1_DERFA|nr:hypothetical protein DERF_001438 [Dermatophagoides farinae]